MNETIIFLAEIAKEITETISGKTPTDENQIKRVKSLLTSIIMKCTLS